MPQIDMFLLKKEQLKHWMMKKKIFRGDEITRWGVENYYDSARRRAREFMVNGETRPLNDREKELMNYTGKCEIYMWIGG